MLLSMCSSGLVDGRTFPSLDTTPRPRWGPVSLFACVVVSQSRSQEAVCDMAVDSHFLEWYSHNCHKRFLSAIAAHGS